MKAGFSKANLLDAVDWPATTVVTSSENEEQDLSRESKFEISDRVIGMWRPENGGKRKIVKPLHMSLLYGEDQNGPFVLAGIDHCDIEFHDLDLMRKPICNECGIPENRVIFMPSHCHVTLTYDTAKLQRLIVLAVKKAKESCVEAEICALHPKIDGPRLVINRRVFVEGIGTRTIMFNDFSTVMDDHLDATEQIKAWLHRLGADQDCRINDEQRYVTHQDVDDRLQAVFFRHKGSTKIIGSFVRFAAHAVIVSEKKVNGDISADYPGYLKNRLENEAGGIALFAQGLSGDLRPLNSEYSHNFARNYGEQLADTLLSRLRSGEWRPLDDFFFYSAPLLLPLRKDLPQNSEEYLRQMDTIESRYDETSDPVKKRTLQNDFWFYYRNKEVLNCLRPEWRSQGYISTQQFGVKLNDTAIILNPGELFYATGMDMIAPYQDQNPITVGNVNEYISYIPPVEEFDKGGYEPSVSLVTPDATKRYIANTQILLKKMMGNE